MSKTAEAQPADMIALLQELMDAGELVALEASTEWGTPIEQQGGETVRQFLGRVCDEVAPVYQERMACVATERRREADEAEVG